MEEEDSAGSNDKQHAPSPSSAAPAAANQHRRPHHQHRRSASWCGPAALPPPNGFWEDEAEENDTSLPAAAEEETEDVQLPLASLKVSEKALTSRNRLINKIRNGVGMRLDLEAVGKEWRDNDDDEGAQGGDAELWRRKERMAACDKECSCILPYLFLSGKTVAQNLSTLCDCRITHIINCVGFVCPEYFPNDFVYKTLWLQDSPNEDIMCILYDVFDYIEKVREQSGGRVLLHCCQGVSRSPALTIAYLMWRKNECFEDAFHDVKCKRNVVSPNMGFATQLMQWQSKILDPPDRQASQLYRIAPHSVYDPLYLVPKVVATASMEALDSRGAFVIRMANMLYIWRGRHCDKEMVAKADHAAFQLVRYEHAQGPSMLVIEGCEPIDVLKAWSELCAVSGEGGVHCRKIEMDGKHVPGYDSDYETYKKAKSGMYVPPVIGSGVVINFPAREEKWSQLRETFLNSPRRVFGKC